MGLLCDDNDIEENMLWLRNKIYDIGDRQNGVYAWYIYQPLATESEERFTLARSLTGTSYSESVTGTILGVG